MYIFSIVPMLIFSKNYGLSTVTRSPFLTELILVHRSIEQNQYFRSKLKNQNDFFDFSIYLRFDIQNTDNSGISREVLSIIPNNPKLFIPYPILHLWHRSKVVFMNIIEL
jgi:hypothetical protein